MKLTSSRCRSSADWLYGTPTRSTTSPDVARSGECRLRPKSLRCCADGAASAPPPEGAECARVTNDEHRDEAIAIARGAGARGHAWCAHGELVEGVRSGASWPWSAATRSDGSRRSSCPRRRRRGFLLGVWALARAAGKLMSHRRAMGRRAGVPSGGFSCGLRARRRRGGAAGIIRGFWWPAKASSTIRLAAAAAAVR